MFIVLIVSLYFSAVYSYSNYTAYRYENKSEHYFFCSFFNNRAPQTQPNLKNCTWFRENSCCLQHEIDVTFSRVKPLVGASEECQKYTNYLMCYICAPNQNAFYRKERLTVCESFCDLLYDACKLAILKGNQINQLYNSSKQFCLGRRFLIGQKDCFLGPSLENFVLNSGNNYNFLQLHCLVLALLIITFYIPYLYSFESECNTVNIKLCQTSRLKMLTTFFLVIFVLYLAPVSAGNDIIEIRDISELGRSVSLFLGEYAENTIEHPSYEKFLQSNDAKNVSNNFILEEVSHKIGHFFQHRINVVKRIITKLSSAQEKFFSSNTTGNMSYVFGDNLTEIHSDISSSHTIDFMKIKGPSANSNFQFKLSESVDGDDENILKTILWSESLEEVSYLNNDSYVKRTYFASSDGVFRIYPKQKWKFSEPRVQPWYLGVKEAPSNVILIIDASYTTDLNKFKRTKDIALMLLSSLAHHQRVAVIASSSVAWTKNGIKHNASASMLGCVKDRLVRATFGNQRMFMEGINNIKPHGGSYHKEALYMAFDLLRAQQISHPKYLECRSVILFVTDGEQDEEHLRCSSGYQYYTEGNTRVYQQGEICQYDTNILLRGIQRKQRNLPGAKAIVFTFLTSQTRRADAFFPGQLACQNNGALSRVYGNKDLFSQMSPFFDYIRAREFSLDPIITGPYESPFDGSIVLTFSAPVSSIRSNRILGVVGIDVLFSNIESLLEEHHENLFMMNLVDGSAVVHPLIQKSYEGKNAWIDAPIMDLEMEDSGHSTQFPDILRRMMQRMNGSEVVEGDASEGIEIEEGRILWRPVQSISYSFTCISGTYFGVGIKEAKLKKLNYSYFIDMPTFQKPTEPEIKHTNNYLHTLIGMPNLQETLKYPLNITTQHVLYQGVPVSFQHSSIILAPPAFCQSSSSHLQFHSQKFEIQDSIGGPTLDDEEDVNDDEDDEKNQCLLTRRAREDIFLSNMLERSWKDVRMIAKSLKSLYVATINGVIRHYPGLQVPESIIRHPLRYQWFVQAMLNQGRIVITNNRASFSGVHDVITMSRLIDSAQKVVLAADLVKDELKEKIMHAVKRKNDICCPPYPHSLNISCIAKCYLISHQGEIVISLSDGLDRSRSKFLHQQFPFVFKTLAKHRLLLLTKTAELRRNCLLNNDMLKQLKDDDMHHPCRACMVIKQEPCIVKSSLDEMGGTFGRSSDGSSSEDSCHKGIFFLTSVNNTNLFFLTLVNYTSKYSKQCNQDVANVQKLFDHKKKLLCPQHVNYYLSRTNSTTCPKKRFISLYCRYSSTSKEKCRILPYVTALLVYIFNSLFHFII